MDENLEFHIKVSFIKNLIAHFESFRTLIHKPIDPCTVVRLIYVLYMYIYVHVSTKPGCAMKTKLMCSFQFCCWLKASTIWEVLPVFS